MGKIKNKIFTWTWGTVTVISSFSPTTSSAGLEVSTEAGLKSSMITANIVHVSFTNKFKKITLLLAYKNESSACPENIMFKIFFQCVF